MIPSVLVDPKDKRAIGSESFWAGPHTIDPNERALYTLDPIKAHSTFKSLSATVAGTVTLTEPNEGGSLLIADLILNTEKAAGGAVEVRWNDDTRTITIFKAFCSDAPANIALSFNGRVQGWQGARLEVVTTANTDNSVFLSYVKMPNSLLFAEWDALR